MLRPILEYGNLIWGPNYVLVQCKLEGVQWHSTKLVLSLRDKSYIDRLTSLNLPSLGLLHRFRHGDLIFLFKLLNGYFELDYSNFLHYLTTHILEVIHLNYLSHLPIIYVASTFGARIINDWNNLTSDSVTNSSLNSFKSAVDNYFCDFRFYVS